jgi:hypothetical protein
MLTCLRWISILSSPVPVFVPAVPSSTRQLFPHYETNAHQTTQAPLGILS